MTTRLNRVEQVIHRPDGTIEVLERRPDGTLEIFALPAERQNADNTSESDRLQAEEG